jgi:hypothetical protein
MAGVISVAGRKDLLQLVKEWYAKHGDAGNLAEAEALAEETRQLVGEIVLEASLLPVTGKATYQGRSLKCDCGARARFVNYRCRWVKSPCGEVRVGRAYYHCATCKSGQTPWDKAQGLNERVWSPRLKGMVCRAVGRLTYAEGCSVLLELCGISLEESSAEAIVLEVGPRIRAEEEKRTAQAKEQTKRAMAEKLMVDVSTAPTLLPLPVRAVEGRRLYASVDATTAHIDGEWHNVQAGMVFTVRSDEDGRDTLLQREYLSGRMNMETLGWKMRTLACSWNHGAYSERVFLGDGAPCNWNLASTHFPDAICILDFYHASEHVWELSRALYRQEDTAQKALGDRWVHERLTSLKKEGPKPFLRALKRRKGKTPKQQEALKKALHYFVTNAGRMDYGAHLKAGRMIGSGPIEAACKVVVGQRLKGAGMRWTDAGADAILAVRTTLLNGNSQQLPQLARAA